MGIFLLFVVAAVGILIATGMGQTASSSATQDSSGSGTAPVPAANTGGLDNVPDPGNIVASMHITNDPSTWPSGDVIWNICRAIAIAEGANVQGSVPDVSNNPGDISDGAHQFPQNLHSGSMVTVFPDKQTGWSWLYQKVYNAATGASSVYLPTMTWTEIAQKWAGNWQNWVTNVTTQLAVDPNSTLDQYAGMAS